MKKILICVILTITSYALLQGEDKKIKNNSKSLFPSLFSKSSSEPKKKITPLEYLQKEYSGVLRKNTKIKKYLSTLKHSSVDENFDDFVELDFIAPTVKVLHETVPNIISPNKKKSKNSQEAFKNILIQLDTIKNPILRNFAAEIANVETSRLDKKAIRAKQFIDNRFATEVYFLGYNLTLSKKD